MTPAFPAPAWLVGCGNMAGAMVEGWRAAGVDLSQASPSIRPSGTPVEGVRTVTALSRRRSAALRHARLQAAEARRGRARAGAARRPETDRRFDARRRRGGEPARALSRARGRSSAPCPICRSRRSQGVIALYQRGCRRCSCRQQLGAAVRGARHGRRGARRGTSLAAIGAVAGAGPAYVARFVDALAKGGEALGLDPELAEHDRAPDGGRHGAMPRRPARPWPTIARRVASPKGTTEQGLAVLDAPDGLSRWSTATLDAAIRARRGAGRRSRRAQLTVRSRSPRRGARITRG